MALSGLPAPVVEGVADARAADEGVATGVHLGQVSPRTSSASASAGATLRARPVRRLIELHHGCAKGRWRAGRAGWATEVTAMTHDDPSRRARRGVPGDMDLAVLDALFTQSPVGLHVLDTDLRLVRINTATRPMHHVPVEGLLGRPFAEAFTGLNAPGEVTRLIRGVLETGIPVRERLVRTRLDSDQGRERARSMSVFRLSDEAGVVLGVAVAAVDVTEAEEARARLRVRDAVRERVGRSLDVITTCEELAETLVEAFADVAVVEVVEAVVRGEEPPAGPLAQDVPLRRAAFRSREGGRQEQAHPVGDVRSLRNPTPYSRTLTDLHPRIVALDEDSPWLGTDPRRAGAIRASASHSLLVAPLALRGNVLGLISLYRTEGSAPFLQGDLGLVREVCSHTALCVDNARRFTREHTIAATVQRHMLPRLPMGQSTVETAHLHVPAEGGGGGWFDVIALSGARTALVVGNVSGHGIHTATTMGQLRTVVHALAGLDLEPDELLARLDDTAGFLAVERAAPPTGLPARLPPLSASCLYGVYDPFERTWTFACAGQPTPPVIVRPDGPAETADLAVGPVLGGGGGWPFATTTVELTEGSTLALYTPGLLPAAPAATEDVPDLLREVLAHPGRPLQDLCDNALYALGNLGGGDDAVLLLARTRAFPAHCADTRLLADDLTEAAAARRYTRRTLESWGVDADTVAGTELIVSELVTNALRYGSPPLRLRLIKDRALTCEVHDASSTSPHLRHARAVDEGGRGLFIVAQLAQRWGIRYTAAGKTVWTEQDLAY
ncbi:SpoIIE family protein phosphatase [Streptomyces sp. NPDC001568]|uniref:SpoIIE family protein phosphatase n=1 Tax=Streptomyces sp. NPDC001568 TaxID=3364588 RepID=UPI0036A7D936